MKWLELYFDGGWVKYMLAFVAGMSVQRFVITPTDADAYGLSAAAAVSVIILAMRRAND